MTYASSESGAEWFARPDNDTGKPGLSFSCTMCGNCCSGDGGYVLFTDAESKALAARLGVTVSEFLDRYTHDTIAGRSLREKKSESGYECIFLDRNSIPGKGVCGVYEDRPMQCRTWPFWRSNLAGPWSWANAAKTCPGLNSGRRYSVQEIRVLREKVDM
ncbi:MAG: YkgJ family cysteine cluster protein [Phycisphaerae bacterium]|nr:YkgJ family cysteine cluster protein [Phycisphaerae bacterium]